MFLMFLRIPRHLLYHSGASGKLSSDPATLLEEHLVQQAQVANPQKISCRAIRKNSRSLAQAMSSDFADAHSSLSQYFLHFTQNGMVGH